ncbi:MAG TPA: UpxY family transcription antiterminator [Longimicrobiaceae bacterium]|nr:UpxY family transcription antiterminator [Longimicrobiaceae bacterium]
MPIQTSGTTFEPSRSRAPEELYDEPHWYACQTRARHEKKVDSLLRRQKIESYLPVAPRVSQWKDRRKSVEWPLFPGYVFARFTLSMLGRLLSTHGVVSVVSLRGYPAVIPASEIESVRLLVASLGQAGCVEMEPAPQFNAGERVKVVGGPFDGVEGTVVERREGRRVLVGIRVIGQALQVDVGTASLVVVSPPS